MSERSKIVTLRHLISRFAPAIPPLSLRATSPDPGESVLKGKPKTGGCSVKGEATLARGIDPYRVQYKTGAHTGAPLQIYFRIALWKTFFPFLSFTPFLSWSAVKTASMVVIFCSSATMPPC